MAPKRSRDNDAGSKQPHGKRRKEEGAEPVAADPAAQEASVKAYMFHAVKLLHKALKKSRTFEVQKLGRKVKLTREPKEGTADPAVVADLDAQLVALKALSIDPIPPYLLSTRLPKATYLHPILPSILASLPTFTPPTPLELDPKTAEGKARNRTLANKLVKEAWDEVSRAVAKRMGQEVEDRPVKAVVVANPLRKVQPAASTSEMKVEEEGGGEVEGPTKRLSKRAERKAKGAAKALLPKPSIKMNAERLALVAGSDDDDDESGSEDEGPLSGSELDDDDDVEAELARLGGAGSEGEWSGSEEDDEGVQSDADDDEDDAASTSSFPVGKATAKTSKPSKKDSKAGRKPITSSAFLPTLAGGYISYSDSDGEDAKWIKAGDKEDKKERKNRRGQRARQAIWEKKYGSGANHVVKETGGKPAPVKLSKADAKKKDKKARTADDNFFVTPFDPSKAPDAHRNVNAQPLGERKIRRPTVTYNNPVAPPVIASKVVAPTPPSYQQRGPARPPAPVKSKIEEGMHPSWVAKKKAAEALQNLAAVAPKGKKITFD